MHTHQCMYTSIHVNRLYRCLDIDNFIGDISEVEKLFFFLRAIRNLSISILWAIQVSVTTTQLCYCNVIMIKQPYTMWK